MKHAISILLLFLFLNALLAQGDTDIPVEEGGGSSSGGGHKQIDFDKILKALQEGKDKKPQEFEQLKTLLWKNPITNEKYKVPVVLMYYEGNNTTVSRNQPLDIITIVTNNNLPEQRRMLDMYYEVKNPGSNKYERLNSWPEKIQANEYNDKNTTQRVWGMLPSFSYLKNVGKVSLRANVSDGVYKWSTASYSDLKPPFYSELVFNLTNIPPTMSDFNLTPSGLVRYNDPIVYKATIADKDEDMLNVTLHILDEKGTELKNQTSVAKAGDVRFKANDYGFFSEADAGKNFTYYYSFDDGINASRTENMTGPRIKKGPKLFVDRLGFSTSSESNYWWQQYGFNIRAKNLNPEEYDVTFTLSTKTAGNEWNTVDTKTVKIGPEAEVIYFNDSKPFLVADANKTFSYRIKFSEYDQNDKDYMDAIGPRINAKVIPYAINNGVMISNLALMFIFVIGLGLFIERRLKRGIESQESSSRKSSSVAKLNATNSGNSIVNRITSIFRKRG
jgi:hypothetical protein